MELDRFAPEWVWEKAMSRRPSLEAEWFAHPVQELGHLVLLKPTDVDGKQEHRDPPSPSSSSRARAVAVKGRWTPSAVS